MSIVPPLRVPTRLHPTTIAGGLVEASLASARTGLRASQEIVSLAAHVAMYPAGVLAEAPALVDDRARLDPLSPVTRGLLLGDVAAAGTPVVLVHGIVDNRAAFTVIRRALQRRGFGRVTTLNYSPLTADVAAAAERLGRHVERICDQTGYDQVNIVGHSLGGIIARYYVQRRGGDRRVRTLVTLGSPHQGTRLARLLPLPVARQLRPGAQVIRELAAPTRARCRVVSVHSDRDEIVVPASSGVLTHPDLDVTNVAVHGVGHLALLVDSAAVGACVDALVPPQRPATRARVAAGAVG
jgi:triacylglycerol lipase